jgi:hypothetical protein
MPLYRSLNFCFLLLVSRSLILPFKDAPFTSSYMFYWFNILNFADCLHWFGLDFATIVI